MRVSLGEPVTIENVGGASGSIGVGRAARADPDGYTLCLGNWPTHVVNAAVLALRYDVLVGGVSHVAGVFFQTETGTRFRFIPYRGLGPAMQDLVAGQIDMLIDSPTNALPQVRAGSIKAYAVTAKRRLIAAPEIPTVDEAGLPGFYMSSWHALWVPKGTAKSIVGRLNDAVVKVLADPIVGQRLAHLGQEIFPREQQTPEALRAHHKSEIEKWWPIIKAAGIKAQ
jgi:tripartite-type tricarboxylate transporter receptor subunit TctC